MRREDLLQAKVTGKEVYYKSKWWLVACVTDPKIQTEKVLLIQVDKCNGATVNSGWIDTDLVHTNPCELCDLPADGLDQVHCQEHWEQVCADAYWEQLYGEEGHFTLLEAEN